MMAMMTGALAESGAANTTMLNGPRQGGPAAGASRSGDRFGGQMARAAIVTAERGNIRMRNRASELGIRVIDLNDLKNRKLGAQLKACMNSRV